MLSIVCIYNFFQVTLSMLSMLYVKCMEDIIQHFEAYVFRYLAQMIRPPYLQMSKTCILGQDAHDGGLLQTQWAEWDT